MKGEFSIIVLLTLVFGFLVVGVEAEKKSAEQVSSEAPHTVNPVGESQHGESYLSSLVAGNTENVEFVGRTGGSTLSIAVSGNYAYVGEGPSLTVMDISDPTLPHVIGRATNLRKYAFIHDIVVAGYLAYVADGSGLSIIDIRNPHAPIEVGYYDAPEEIVSVAVAGDYAYIGSSTYLSEYDLRIINVVDPATPYETAAYNIEGGIDGGVVNMTVDGGYIYFVDWHGTLLVVNVMNPEAPYLNGAIPCGGRCTDVAVKDEFAYVATDWQMAVINISDPASPIKVGSINTSGSAQSIALGGNYAYVGAKKDHSWDPDDRLLIIDISNSAAPFEVGSLTTFGFSTDIVLAEESAYLATDWGGLHVVDIEEPSTPIEVGFFKVLGSAEGMTVAGDYAYIVDWPGLHIISIADPALPKSIGLFKSTILPMCGYYCMDMRGTAIAKDHIYVPAGENGVGIIDVTNPRSPIDVGFLDTPGIVRDIKVVGQFAYVSDGEHGFRIFSIANPTEPVEIGYIDTPGWATRVNVVGNYAYLIDVTSLRIINIADPFDPREIGFIPGHFTDVTIVGHYAYLDQDGTQLIFDVADASEPVLVGLFDVGGTILAFDGNYAYIAGYSLGLRIFSLANPLEPVEVGSYDMPAWELNMSIVDDYMYLADASGLSILRFTGKETHFSISGRVATQNGAALPGVLIDTAAGHATTDTNGNYIITGVPAGTYNVGPTFAGYTFAPTTRSVTVPPDAAGIDFVGAPEGAYSISGKILLGDGTPLQGVTVSVGFGHHDTTDVEGKYLIDGLDAGTYEVDALLPGFTFAPSPVALPPSRTSVDASLTEHDFDINFRPQPHGYSFKNGDLMPILDSDFTLLDFQRMLGNDVACLIPPLSYGGRCLAWWPVERGQFEIIMRKDKDDKAYCFGMAATSALIYKDPSWLPPAFQYTFEMNTLDARRGIAYFQTKQYLQPIKNHVVDDRSSITPNDVLDEIKTALNNNSGLILGLTRVEPGIRKSRGHALVPYALDQESDSLWKVMVYDGNYPSPYEVERYVLIDTRNNVWSYELKAGEIWSGNSFDHTLITIPIALLDAPVALSSSAYPPEVELNYDTAISEATTNSIYHLGDGALLITDAQGRKIGFHDNELVNEIPKAATVVPFEGPDVALQPIYVVPANESYEILVDGQTIGDYQRTDSPASVALFGPDFLVSANNIPINVATQDSLTIAPDGSMLTYQASQSAQPNLTLIFEEEASSSQFQIEGADLAKGQTVSMEVDPASKRLSFIAAEAGDGVYDLSITLADTIAEHQFRHSGIEIGAGDTHYIDYSEWNGTGPVTLQIDDGSDGTIDEEHELGEGPLSYQILLPIVTKVQ